MATQSGSKLAVYAALVASVLIAISKFAAAVFTGSSAMIAEGVHSMVDGSVEVLLLYGIRRAARPPDETHPLGHGRELYFWSFVVSVLIFALGAGVSVYEGILHILSPHPMENVNANYLVLGLSALFDGISWTFAVRQFNRERGSRSYVEAIRESKDPMTFTVLVGGFAALVGIAIALAGIFAAATLGHPEIDGIASIGVGLLLAATAIFLARESKNLLIGEPALPHVREDILRIAGADPAILKANGLITTQLGPDQIVAALSAEFADHLSADDIEQCVERLEAKIAEAHPEVTTLFVKPQPHRAWREEIAEIEQESR
jgi:cation diffusion facilitator family transporter